ncbi:MAG: hypothetical protein KA205_03450 [Acidobacteria bacterium]|nr:hypothetical protein [Acidobacteriota bacterium]
MSRVQSPWSTFWGRTFGFVILNVMLWFVMTGILLVLPDQLVRWMDLSVGRAVAWAVAGAVWVVAIERQWQARMGALARFPLQVLLWVSSALVAMWLSDQFRLR